MGYADIRLPPLLRNGELVEAVPGMAATQHSGSGKANQYFLRGFNLDHGTDFSAFANDVPINLRTHGHGQGYLDLNFLIPELVATTTYRKGPYFADVGDFSSAGSANFEYFERVEESLISGTLGADGYYRGVGVGSLDVDDGVITAAVDIARYSGPWELDEDLKQERFYLAYAGQLGQAATRFSLAGYSGEWNSTDQLPKRAIDSGAVSRLGFIDPDLGGRTDRYEVSASADFHDWRIAAYVVDYDFSLYSNFTFWLDDPINGDEFEQVDDRLVSGFRISGHRGLDVFGQQSLLRWGADLRYDDIEEVGLFPTVARERVGTIRKDSVSELSVGGYAELGVPITESLRATAGIRVDRLSWDVDALRTENSGRGNEALVSPKLNFAYQFSESWETYLNWGRGFHTNDVRGATIALDPGSGAPADPVDVFARSNGAELGLRFEHGDVFNTTLAFFWLELDSELVFTGDAGTTEPNDGSRRIGAELATFWKLTPWLAANLAYAWTDSEFEADQGGGREIPGAISTNASLGLNAAWDNGAYVSLRVRHLGEAPLTEDGAIEADSSTLVNARAGYRWKNLEFRLEVFNALDSDDQDIAYYFSSRLQDEPLAGVPDVHFHPLEPRTVRGSVTFYWQ